MKIFESELGRCLNLKVTIVEALSGKRRYPNLVD